MHYKPVVGPVWKLRSCRYLLDASSNTRKSLTILALLALVTSSSAHIHHASGACELRHKVKTRVRRQMWNQRFGRVLDFLSEKGLIVGPKCLLALQSSDKFSASTTDLNTHLFFFFCFLWLCADNKIAMCVLFPVLQEFCCFSELIKCRAGLRRAEASFSLCFHTSPLTARVRHLVICLSVRLDSVFTLSKMFVHS